MLRQRHKRPRDDKQELCQDVRPQHKQVLVIHEASSEWDVSSAHRLRLHRLGAPESVPRDRNSDQSPRMSDCSTTQGSACPALTERVPYQSPPMQSKRLRACSSPLTTPPSRHRTATSNRPPRIRGQGRNNCGAHGVSCFARYTPAAYVLLTNERAFHHRMDSAAGIVSTRNRGIFSGSAVSP